MSDFVEAAGVAGLKDSAVRKATVNGKELLFAKAGNEYFCTDARCPHLGGDLTMGTLQGTILTCPLHGSQFDLRDGRVLRWTDWTGLKASITKALKAPRPLKTYPVKVEGEKVFVKLD